MSFETIVDGFMTAMNTAINTVFFFVTPMLLVLFALSVLVLNITKTGKKWLKYSVNILYILYIVFRITEIKDFVVYARWDQVLAMLPFFCMALLPAIAKKTHLGEHLLSYNALMIYYTIFNAIWLLIVPTDGNVIIMLVYALIMFVVGQILEYYKENEGKSQ